MKVIGLFIVVFGGLVISRSIGFSESAQLIGAIMGAGTYILIMTNAQRRINWRAAFGTSS